MRGIGGGTFAAVLMVTAVQAGEPVGAGGMAAGQFENRFSAVVELGASFGTFDNSTTRGDSATGTGLVSVSAPLGVAAGVQLDVENTFTRYSGDRVWRDVTATAHLFARDPQRGAIGVVAAGSHLYPDNAFGGTWDAWAAGFEALAYIDRVTATAQVAYADYDFPGNRTEAVIANAGLRYFPSDNTMLAGKLGVVGNEPATGADWTLIQGQARVEHRFADTPFSVGANYLYTSWDSDRWEQVFGLFGRVYLGGESLFENDRAGRTMDPLTNPLVWN